MAPRGRADGEITGKTWPDVVAAIPVWLLGIAAIAFVALLVYALLFLREPKTLGFLGTFGPHEAAGLPTEVPPGAVIAFDGKCPNEAGWRPYELAAGRFVLGAGQGPLLSAVFVGQQFGEEVHELTPEEIPGHQHHFTYRYVDIVAGNKGFSGAAKFRTISFVDKKAATEPDDRRAKAHGNMPPYVVLQFCKKVAG